MLSPLWIVDRMTYSGARDWLTLPFFEPSNGYTITPVTFILAFSDFVLLTRAEAEEPDLAFLIIAWVILLEPIALSFFWWVDLSLAAWLLKLDFLNFVTLTGDVSRPAWSLELTVPDTTVPFLDFFLVLITALEEEALD